MHCGGPAALDTVRSGKGVLRPGAEVRRAEHDALDLWTCLNGVTLEFSKPDKLGDNGFVESFKRIADQKS